MHIHTGKNSEEEIELHCYTISSPSWALQ